MSGSTTGSLNVSVGHYSLTVNTTGNNNTAVGNYAMSGSTVGVDNVAVGYCSLGVNIDGNYNTSIGSSALRTHTGGSNNVAIGYNAMTGSLTGTNNIAIGVSSSLVNGNNQIIIGSNMTSSAANSIRIGASSGSSGSYTSNFQSGIRGITTAVADAVPVLIDSKGQLGTVSSTIRKKRDVIDMGDSTSALRLLRPVKFKWKPEVSSSEDYNYGLIAEEVDEVMPDLVIKNEEGQCETVRYHDLAVMLLNEWKKCMVRIEELENKSQ